VIFPRTESTNDESKVRGEYMPLLDDFRLHTKEHIPSRIHRRHLVALICNSPLSCHASCHASTLTMLPSKRLQLRDIASASTSRGCLVVYHKLHPWLNKIHQLWRLSTSMGHHCQRIWGDYIERLASSKRVGAVPSRKEVTQD
jgi:hypothetical protein